MTFTASFLKRFWKDQSGGTLPEIVVFLALIGTALAVAMSQLGDRVTHAVDNFWPG